MKKIIFCVVGVVLCIGVGVYAKAPPSKKFKRSNVQMFKEPFVGWEKLDVGAKNAWREWAKKQEVAVSGERLAVSTNDQRLATSDHLELMVRTNAPVKEDQKRVFEKVGFKYRSVIPFAGSSVQGSIVTGKILAKNLQELAAIEFVDYIEAAKPLTIKQLH